ncbi:MAG: indolepyruvate oxidoreductase subunit beta [Pseudomonadota bacterium]
MEANIILAGVGGQGILSMAYILSQTALDKGLNVKQSEVHGMAQRGGAVESHLRISARPIASDLIPRGSCNLLISVEPLEATRYLDFLAPNGIVVTSMTPYKNIPDYPSFSAIWKGLEGVRTVIPMEAESLAKQAGSALAQNTVLIGAASVFLDFPEGSLEACIGNAWRRKGERVVETNLKAFASGRKMARFLAAAAEKKIPREALHLLAAILPVDRLDSLPPAQWADSFTGKPRDRWEEMIRTRLASESRAASV